MVPVERRRDIPQTTENQSPKTCPLDAVDSQPESVETLPARIAPIYRVVGEHGIGFATVDMPRSKMTRLVNFPEAPLRTTACELVKQGRSTLLTRVNMSFRNATRLVAYKRVRRHQWWKPLSDLFRTNRALKSWRMGRKFLEQGIATARPVAIVIPRRYETHRDTFVVTEWLDNSQDLHQFIEWTARLSARQRGRNFAQAAVQLGRLLRRMHDNHFSHRDLKAANLLLVCDHEEVAAYVIDLDGVSEHRQLSPQLKMRNLARLQLSLADASSVSQSTRMRFLKAYLGEDNDGERRKEFWQGVKIASLQLAERKARTNKQVA